MNDLKRRIDSEMKEVHYTMDTYEKKSKCRHLHINKVAAAAIAAVIILGGGAGVYAGVTLNARLNSIPEEKKAEYVTDIQTAPVEADSYSRELTEDENTRIESLRTQYENNGVFPEGEITKIADASQAAGDKVCFLPATSTFYFPETSMTDEELLEIIDFYYQRDFSLQSSQPATQQQ